MKNKAFVVANSVAITTGVVYLTCAFSVLLFPDFSINIAKTWFHGMDISRLAVFNITPVSFVVGLLTSAIYAWFIGYVFARIYDLFNK